MSNSPLCGSETGASRRGSRVFAMGAGAAAVFAAAFAWGAWRAYTAHVVAHVPLPDFPALVDDPAALRPIPIPDFVLHERAWDWPEGGRFFVLPEGIEGLPPKRLSAAKDAVDKANAQGAQPPWQWTPNGPNAARGFQLAAAAAWVGDWWTIRMRHALAVETSRFSLRPERGLSPLALAALYEHCAAERPEVFSLSGPRRPDPVARRPSPCSLPAMARLFAIAAEARSTSSTLFPVRPSGWPAPGEALRFEAFAMAGPPLEILPCRPVESPDQARAASDALAGALRDFGILLVGLTEGAWSADTSGGDPALFLEQAGVLVGYYEKGARRLFLLRSPLGFSMGKGRPPTPTALAPVRALAGAWAFPHPFRAEWSRQGQRLTRLRVADPEGKPLGVAFPEELSLEFDGMLWRGAGGEIWIVPAACLAPGRLGLSLHPRFFMPPTAVPALRLPPVE